MSKYYNVDYADQDLTFIIQKSGYGRYVDELERRIDKAIEYIENELSEECGNVSGSDLPYYVIDELLDILKGSDSNENE